MADSRDLQVQDNEKQEIDETSAERTRDRLAFVPRADIFETGDAITVVADMPGVDEASIDINLEDDVLGISGYVNAEQPEGFNLVHAEYRVGDYERAFRLPEQIDRNGIEASVKDGVLRVVLPKTQQARLRKIPVKVG